VGKPPFMKGGESMKNFNPRPWMVLFLGFVFISGLCLADLAAQEKMKIGGKAEVEYTKREAMDIGDVEGHMMTLSQLAGTNKSTGENMFMDGADVTIYGFSDSIKGNGHAMGYSRTKLGDDCVFIEYKGEVKTTLVEGKPVTVFETTCKFIKGTGKYENIQGEYTATAKMVSETKMVIESQGYYFIKE
jgi:hypothetical protein